MLGSSNRVWLCRPVINAWKRRRGAPCRPRAASSLAQQPREGQQQVAAAAGSSGAEGEPLAAYVHLPFCKRKCRYCDFPVIAVGMAPPADRTADAMADYVDLLCREIRATRRLNHRGPLKTVFFGGGTPSLISLPLLEQILRALDAAFGIASGAEVSIEADPGTFDAGRLRSYMGLRVNRFSVGVQAFQEELLALCGRGHDLRDVYRAIEAVYAADVKNWSLDLMSGLPQLTPDLWQSSLAAALDAAPHHLSIYDLQVEEHTPFAKLYRPGVAPLPSDEEAAAMYCAASATLRGAGYEHYEVSNYARPGHRSAHNMVYWEGGAFYGFGMGSASYLLGRRFSRPKRLHAYRKWVDDFVLLGDVAAATGSGNSPVPGSADAAAAEERDELGESGGLGVPGLHLLPETPHDKLLDTVMLRLRLSDGLDLRTITGKSADGEALSRVVLRSLEPHIEAGLVQCLTEEDEQREQQQRAGASGRGGSGAADERAAAQQRQQGPSGGEVVRVRLTDPQGFVVSNDIISDVFAALDGDGAGSDED